MKRISDENATILAVCGVIIFFFLLTFGCATFFYSINEHKIPVKSVKKEKTK